MSTAREPPEDRDPLLRAGAPPGGEGRPPEGLGSAEGGEGQPPEGPEGLPAELAYPSDEFIRWYRRLAYPKATLLVFQDQGLYDQLCAFCRVMANLVVSPCGRITQVFCLHCCAVISEYGPNRCTGGSQSCIGTRYVDAVGAVAFLCNGCHQHEEHARRKAAPRCPRARAPAPRKVGAGSGRAPAGATGRSRTLAKNPQ